LSEADLVRLDQEDGVAIITLADPDHRNALSWAVSHALADAVAAAQGGDVGAIVLTAEPPVFCAGGSLPDLLEPKGPLRGTYAGFLAVAQAEIPTIAAVNGPCIGAGVNLPLACDVVLCSPDARFDPRFLDIGIAPGGGHFWRLARRVGRQGAAAMTLCGDALDGHEAERAGLAWRCVAADELLPAATALAAKAAARPRELVRRAKAMLAQTVELPSADEAFEAELALQDWSMHQAEFVDRVEAMRARTSSKQ
jgi:enoyl-CoA hydratase